MEKTEYRNLQKAFNANLRRVRGHVAAAQMFMNAGDLARAYKEAEGAQFAAFDAKDLVNNVLSNITKQEGYETFHAPEILHADLIESSSKEK